MVAMGRLMRSSMHFGAKEGAANGPPSRRSMDEKAGGSGAGSKMAAMGRLMRESVTYAIENHEEALNYAMQFARDLEHPMAEKFVGMYVNHYTVDAGEVIPRAAQKLLDLGFEAGIIPHRVNVEFVR